MMMTILTVAVCVMALAQVASLIHSVRVHKGLQQHRDMMARTASGYTAIMTTLSDSFRPPTRPTAQEKFDAQIVDMVASDLDDDSVDGWYSVEECNGHWHVLDPDGDRVGGLYLTERAAEETRDTLNMARQSAAALRADRMS